MKNIINAIFVLLLIVLVFFIIKDINASMTMKQWVELLLFEFVLQLLLEVNRKYLK